MNVLPRHRGVVGKIWALNDILMNGEFYWGDTKKACTPKIRLDSTHYTVNVAPEYYDALEDCHHLSYVTIIPTEHFEENIIDFESEDVKKRMERG